MPFLGTSGMWQASEDWHPAPDADAGAETVTVPLGPAIIDPIVSEPTNVTYKLTVTVGASKQATTLKVIRPLFGTGAAAPIAAAGATEDEAQRRAEDDARRLEEEEAARKAAAEEENARRLDEEAERRRIADEAAAQAEEEAAAQKAGRRRTLPAVLGLGLLLLAGAAAAAWYGCVIPGFGGAHCRTTAATAVPTAQEAALSCSGLDAAGCYQLGERALQQRQLEPARQLLQQASSLGSIEANIAVARMYDPETWSAETSPARQPNWETAVFWYEKAARQGDLAAEATAGRLLCKNAKNDLERGQGRAYLEQAANAGNDEARQHLSTCQ
jgi:TPR repeat protein